MAIYADARVAFWDGQNKGIAHMMRCMAERGKPVFMVRVEVHPLDEAGEVNGNSHVSKAWLQSAGCLIFNDLGQDFFRVEYPLLHLDHCSRQRPQRPIHLNVGIRGIDGAGSRTAGYRT